MAPGGAEGRSDRRAAARRRAALARAAQRRRARRRRAAAWAGVTAGVIAAIVLAAVLIAAPRSTAAGDGRGSDGPTGPEGVALESGAPLAADTTSRSGAPADGIGCAASEQVAYHIHTHLAVYVDGSPRSLPAGIGIVAPVQQSTANGGFDSATRCYYWLHVHARDGVIHVEAPTHSPVTLGRFFAVWGQPLSATRVASATGALTVFVDGRLVTGDPSRIVLKSREDIQIDVGRRVPFKPVDWSRSRL